MSHSKLLTISVVVPTCHRNEVLRLCLDRLAPGSQTLAADRYEVIVTDDGSRETAEALVREEYPWARWVAGPRKGPAANRNNGARFSQAEWLAFTDDDCLPTPGWLLAFTRVIGSGIHVLEGKTTCPQSFQGPLVIAPVNLTGGCLWSCNLMVRARLFAEIGGFDPFFPHAADEDTDLRERLQRAGHAWQFVPDAVVDHPPVRRVWGRDSAKLWESKVRLAYKHDPSREPLKPHEVVFNALITRARQLHSLPLSVDWVLAAALLPIELFWICRSAGSWDRRHRSELSRGGCGIEASEVRT